MEGGRGPPPTVGVLGWGEADVLWSGQSSKIRVVTSPTRHVKQWPASMRHLNSACFIFSVVEAVLSPK